MRITEKIEQGKTYLGIELGSTRIKASLIDDTFAPAAEGSYGWENSLENGLWTYSLEDIRKGVRGCYADLKRNVSEKYGVTLKKLGAMGVSAMMHGFMAFGGNNELLTPFRTWRNTNTARASKELSGLLDFNIPMRWSAAHLYQAILDGEPYINGIESINTLAGYIHFLLTDMHVIGVGDGSGMFPVRDGGYDKAMLSKFDGAASEKGFSKSLADILPRIMTAGEKGGVLTEKGAAFLDPEGDLMPGVPLCPPEGDAGTGMTATNSVTAGTGNISAGTSVFSMLVLDEPLKKAYPEIDIVTTPDGLPAAMVHCNNCCSEADAWVRLFREFAALAGSGTDISRIYEILYKCALDGDGDCGGVTAYNFLSAEPVAGAEKGSPMYFRTPDSNMSLANFMRAQLYSAIASLKLGMDILFSSENARAEQFTAHGGLFKVRGAAQQILADALDTPVYVTDTAGEGGAWGMALLAAYMTEGGGLALGEWLDKKVFAKMEKTGAYPRKSGTDGFGAFMERYKKGLAAQKAAAEIS
ncbi:MAG: FGGY-family carbohydrate kinase [Ruminococcus sp.]|nr:FGGY-family carbohydrate kinase [Ruminococcus sp.]